ncbi:MAG: hypothetical protein WBN66_03640 [Smithella sp.]
MNNDYQGCEICGTFEAVTIQEDEIGLLHFICEKCFAGMREEAETN